MGWGWDQFKFPVRQFAISWAFRQHGHSAQMYLCKGNTRLQRIAEVGHGWL
jgi:hypothetical protein